MKHRTTNDRFLPCPICGKLPYVDYYLPNTGWAVCKGTFLKPHEGLNAYVQYEQPSKLVDALAEKWNQGQSLKLEKVEKEWN